MFKNAHIDNRIPTIGTLLHVTLTTANCARKSPTADDCINVNYTSGLSGSQSISVLQYTRRIFKWIVIEPGTFRFLSTFLSSISEVTIKGAVKRVGAHNHQHDSFFLPVTTQEATHLLILRERESHSLLLQYTTCIICERLQHRRS